MPLPRYIAFPFGAGVAFAPHEGNTVTPAPRSYGSPEHAQLANPTGRLYEVEARTDSDTLDVTARRDDLYPLDLLETRVAGYGCGAEGAVVLRDMGPQAHHRWAVAFRNDQLGGYSGSQYCATYARGVEAYTVTANKELRRHLPIPEPAEMEAD